MILSLEILKLANYTDIVFKSNSLTKSLCFLSFWLFGVFLVVWFFCCCWVFCLFWFGLGFFAFMPL